MLLIVLPMGGQDMAAHRHLSSVVSIVHFDMASKPARARPPVGLILVLSTVLSSAAVRHVGAASVVLPTAFDANNLLVSTYAKTTTDNIRLDVGGVAVGANNVGSLWTIAEHEQPGRCFGGGSAYAVLEIAQWMRVSRGRWWIGYGSGRRDAYDGNADAAQLWIDLHSGGQKQPFYAPWATNARVGASWFGTGHDFPFQLGKARGTGTLSLRLIRASDYLARSVVGQVSGDQFSGMVRITSARTPTGTVRGSGWALDAQWVFALGRRWQAQVTAEGLLGRMHWRGLSVRDVYVTSPGVFTDPEGFLHDFGGISGAEWFEDLTASLDTCYRLDMIYAAHPNVLLSARRQAGTRSLLSAGLAWPQSRPWLPYFRYHPTQHRLEIGAVGTGWQLRVSGDDWLASSPKHAEIAISWAAVIF